MNDLIIKCPKCKTEIKVTELLAAPLIEKQVAAREAEIKAGEQRRLSAVRVEEQARTQAAIVAATATAKIQFEQALERESELANKLAVAQEAQAAANKAAREFSDKERELNITIEQGITKGLHEVELKTRARAEEATAVRLREK